MTTSLINDLKKLTKEEKIEFVQLLWSDIAQESTNETISIEHEKLLDETLKRIDSGEVSFKMWNEVREKYFTEN
ncbi:MAG: addiction module protein [Bacteroidia bacterium]